MSRLLAVIFFASVPANAAYCTPGEGNCEHKNIVQLAESVKDLSTLVAAVVAGGLADTLSSPGPFTVFAPTNKGFAALPAGTLTKLMKPENKKELVDILTYHVLPEKVLSTDLKLSQAVKTVEGKLLQVTRSGRHVRVGASLNSEDLKNVITADNVASNGVVHIIDGVLIPPATPNIVKLAESVKDLSTLVAAVVAGGLADTLSSPGPFTVFAPTNEAFAALPAGVLAKLMKPESKKELVDILTYHVLPERVLSTDLKLFQAVKTVEGKPLHVTKWDGKVRLGPSLESKDLKNVIKADNLASNGVVHIIDGVLLPPSRAIMVPIPPTAPATKNIVQLAESVKDLSTLVAAVVAGGLADTLSSRGPFTVFAPTNEAFAALPAGVLTKLMKPQSKKELIDILTYHVLPEKVLSKDLKPFQAVKTVEGKPLHVTEWDGKVRLGPSLESKDLKNVIKADNLASNGVVHIIDGVLLPPSAPTPATKNIVQLAKSEKDLSTLVAAVVAGGLADTLSSSGPFTVFAPTNEAFAALPAGVLAKLLKPENKKELDQILKYHVVAGAVFKADIKNGETVKTLEGQDVKAAVTKQAVFINYPTRVIHADVKASNGVIHIVDGVLIPPAAPATKNLVQLAESVKDLSTLVAAVVAGGLADTLSSPGPFTVFAPTNEAFAALPAGVLTNLMKPENKKELIDILTYHVLPEKVLSKDLKPFQAVKTVEGKPLHVTEWDGKVRLGPSLESKDLKNVVKADNLASNGVVHIIDGVLLPPSEAIMIMV